MRAVTIAALLAATPALAQEPPTPITVGKVVSGTWEKTGDVDSYSVGLRHGKDYAIGAYVSSSGAAGQVTLRDPKGNRVGRVIQIGDEGFVGFELRAAFTGAYVITATGDPGTYQIAFDHDCRAAKSTTCRIRPGETKGFRFTSRNDVNWVALQNLAAGRSYALTFESLEGGLADLAVVNPAGDVKGTGTFKAGTGALFARVTPRDDFGGPYKLSLR
jgi:hypothetical protein